MNLSKNILYELSGADFCVIKFQAALFKMDLKYLILSSLISCFMKVFYNMQIPGFLSEGNKFDQRSCNF